jgi:hypothetical protein
VVPDPSCPRLYGVDEDAEDAGGFD